MRPKKPGRNVREGLTKMLVAQQGKNVFPRRKSRTCRDKGLVCRLVRPSHNCQLCRCDTGRHTAVTLFLLTSYVRSVRCHSQEMAAAVERDG